MTEERETKLAELVWQSLNMFMQGFAKIYKFTRKVRCPRCEHRFEA